MSSESTRRREASVLLRRQRGAVDVLRKELQREDGTLGHPYFRDFRSWSNREARPIVRETLLAACRSARVTFVGDFHADPECPKFAARLLEDLSKRVPGFGLAVEFVYTRQQDALDLRQRGRLDDDSFRKRIHYRDQWGFPWEGYRELLDRARDLSVPVFAIDRAPRGGAAHLAARDDHAAGRIVRILAEGRATRLLVFFGESHVTPLRLPRRVRSRGRRVGLDGPLVTVLQDPDGAYWKALEAGETPPSTAELGDGCFAVFHTPPLERYERYRQVLERWRGEAVGEFESDLTPAVHHLIEALARWIGVRPARRRVRHAGDWSESLRDCYPEVYSGEDAAGLLAAILSEHGRTGEEVREAEARFAERGALYESRSNTFFLSRFRPGPAAAEAARFLRTALGGRLFRWPEEGPGDPVERAYGHAYNEAVAFLGARLIDPASSLAERTAPDEGPDRPDAALRLSWMEAHRAFEASGGHRPPASVAGPLRHSRWERRTLARDLGHRLGAEIYGRLRMGRLTTAELRAVFTRALDPPNARRRVLELLRAP